MKIRLASWTFGPLIKHQDGYFMLFRLMASTLHVRKKPDNCIIYISLIWCWSYDRSSSMIRTYTDWLRLSGHVGWLRLSGHVGYLVKYNSQVSPASESEEIVELEEPQGQPCLAQGFFTLTWHWQHVHFQILQGDPWQFRIKQVRMTWPCLEEDVSHHVWSRRAEFREEPSAGSASKSSKFAADLFILPKSFLFIVSFLEETYYQHPISNS